MGREVKWVRRELFQVLFSLIPDFLGCWPDLGGQAPWGCPHWGWCGHPRGPRWRHFCPWASCTWDECSPGQPQTGPWRFRPVNDIFSNVLTNVNIWDSSVSESLGSCTTLALLLVGLMALSSLSSSSSCLLLSSSTSCTSLSSSSLFSSFFKHTFSVFYMIEVINASGSNCWSGSRTPKMRIWVWTTD